MSRDDLFRKQVLEARNAASAKFGRPTATVPPAWSWFLIVLASFFAALICYAALVDFSRKESVEGRLRYSSAEARIFADRAGIIDRVFVENGQLVDAGAPILEIKSEQYLSDGSALSDLANAQLQREANLVAARKDAASRSSALAKSGLQQRKRSLDERINASQRRKDILEQRLELNRSRLNEVKGFLADGLVAQVDVDVRQAEYNQTEAELLAVQRDIEIDQAELKSIDIEIDRTDAELVRVLSEFDQQITKLTAQEKQSASGSEAQLVASIDGQVTGLQVRPGEPVSQGQLALAIVPSDSKLYAEIFLPSRAIAFIETGQRVRLKYDAFPYQKFGLAEGKVKSVSSPAFLSSELGVAAGAEELLYRVEVELAKQSVDAFGKDVPLQSGMGLSADIILEDRSMLDWALGGLRQS